jgi:hypothetical protein
VQAAAGALSDVVSGKLPLAFENGSGAIDEFLQTIGVSEEVSQKFGQDFFDASTKIQDAMDTIHETIQNTLVLIRVGWFQDWAGIRTTWEDFSTRLVTDQTNFWIEWHKAFDSGSEQDVSDWSGFIASIEGFVTRGFATAFEILTGFLHNWNNTTAAFHAAAAGDWATFWSKIGNNFTTAFGLLLSYADVFDGGLKKKFTDAMQHAWDGMKSLWNDIAAWWNSTIGALLGTTITVQTPNFAIVNPQNVAPPPRPSERGGNNVSASSLGGVNIQQHFYGQTDAATVQDASSNGVLTAARSMGMR